eukprot:107224-Rhodomonas_salina.2
MQCPVLPTAMLLHAGCATDTGSTSRAASQHAGAAKRRRHRRIQSQQSTASTAASSFSTCDAYTPTAPLFAPNWQMHNIHERSLSQPVVLGRLFLVFDVGLYVFAVIWSPLQ